MPSSSRRMPCSIFAWSNRSPVTCWNPTRERADPGCRRASTRSVSSPARGSSLVSSCRLIHTHGRPSFAHGSTSWKSDAATCDVPRPVGTRLAEERLPVAEGRLVAPDVGGHDPQVDRDADREQRRVEQIGVGVRQDRRASTLGHAALRAPGGTSGKTGHAGSEIGERVPVVVGEIEPAILGHLGERLRHHLPVGDAPSGLDLGLDPVVAAASASDRLRSARSSRASRGSRSASRRAFRSSRRSPSGRSSASLREECGCAAATYAGASPGPPIGGRAGVSFGSGR